MCCDQTVEDLLTNSNELTLRWRHLSFCMPKNGNEEQHLILKDVCGSAKTNSITAILGPSGAGKTFLLESIAQKINGIDGFVTLDRVIINRNIMNDICGYLPQQDKVTDFLTASEYLQFICTMKLASMQNKSDRSIRIGDVLSEFSLGTCWNTKISDLSGGERKQLLLAAEMLADPLIILCDEPTSGLDGYNALNIIKILKKISSRKKIVIITVHQPSMDIVQYFNNIILLSNGSVILEGSNDDISTFFSTLNITCPVSCNIAEFYVQQISIIPGKENECIQKINNIKRFFKSQSSSQPLEKLKKLQYNKKFTCPLHVQFTWLLWREHLETKRNTNWTLASLASLLFTAAVIAIFFAKIGNSSSTIIQNINGILFLIISELLYTFSFSVLNTFSNDIPIFTREKELYSTVMYYLATIFIKIPQIFIFTYSFLFVISFSTIFSYDLLLVLKISTIIIMGCFVSIAYGFMISALFGTPEYINLVIVPLNLLFILASGVYITLRSLWYGIAWLKHFSVFLYTYESICVLYWNFIDNKECDGNISCKRIGRQALTERGFDENDLNFNILALILLATGMHSVALLAVLYRKKKCSTLSSKSTVFC